jgi:hypothetical protein
MLIDPIALQGVAFLICVALVGLIAIAAWDTLA